MKTSKLKDNARDNVKSLGPWQDWPRERSQQVIQQEQPKASYVGH